MDETILIPPAEWQVIRIDEYKRLTTEVTNLREYFEAIAGISDDLLKLADPFWFRRVAKKALSGESPPTFLEDAENAVSGNQT